MPRLRRETRRYKRRAINSLILAIELFNRPQEVGRIEAVLMLLQHAFEMLLKAAIYERRGTIFPPRERISYGFDRCLGIARSDLEILNEDQAMVLSILDGLRDFAVHSLLDLTEQALYVQAQTAVTLFGDVLGTAFSERLANYLPSRVLPVSTEPPRDILAFLDSEFSQVQTLLSPGRRRKAEARGQLRYLMVMESNLSGDGTLPTDRQVDRMLRRVKQGDTWQSLFPGVASFRLDTQGLGPTVSLRFTRQPEAAPVRVLREGEIGAEEATLVREVNLLDRYSMGLRELAQHVGLTEPKTLALVMYMDLQAQEDCFRVIRIGAGRYKRYSPEALVRLQEVLPDVNMNVIWHQHRPRRSSTSR